MAIRIESDVEKLKVLELQLKGGGPRALKMQQHVKLQLKMQKGQEFTVNRWPDPSIVFQKTTDHLRCSLGESCTLYTTERAPRRELLHFFSHGIVDWSQPVRLAGTAEDLYDPVMEIAESHGTCAQLGRRVISSIAILKQPAQQRPLPEGYYFSGPIRTDTEIDAVNASWKFGGTPESQRYIRDSARLMGSASVRRAQDGHLVAFELQTTYGALGFLHVEPEHRGQGLAKCVMAKLASELQGEGEPVYCTIERENDLSLKLHTGFGFEVLEGEDLVWVTFLPKDNA